MPKTRIKRPVRADITRADVEWLVADIREAKIREQKIINDRNKAVAEIDENCRPHLESLKAIISERTAQVQSWAEANPDEFGKRKSIEFTHGTVGFRTGTPKLALLNRKWTWEMALKAVQNLLPNFIRDTPTIDKDALIGQRHEEIIAVTLPSCGLKVTQDESFFVDPKLEQAEAKATREAKAVVA